MPLLLSLHFVLYCIPLHVQRGEYPVLSDLKCTCQKLMIFKVCYLIGHTKNFHFIELTFDILLYFIKHVYRNWIRNLLTRYHFTQVHLCNQEQYMDTAIMWNISMQTYQLWLWIYSVFFFLIEKYKAEI